MRFEETSYVSHPAAEVLELVMDRMEEIVPFLPNVESIETQKKQKQKDGRVKIIRRWQGASENVPSALRPFISRDLLAWIDTALWVPEEYKVDWSLSMVSAGITHLYECGGTNYFEPDPKNPKGRARIRITGELTVFPDRLPGVPRFLGSRLAPQVEKFIVNMITPNLTDLAKGLQAYFDDREGKTRTGRKKK